MKTATLTICLTAALCAPQLSFAQAQQPAPRAQQPAPRAPAAATVSDADLETFAAIYVDLLETAAKFQPEMEAAQTEEQALAIRERAQAESVAKVAQRGWTPEKFNSIGEAINADPALTDRAVKLIESR